MKKLLLIISAAILTFSCTSEKAYTKKIVNGVETIYNRRPASPEFKINLKKVTEIEADSIFQDIILARLDSKENVYVTDMNACKIHKFDNKGHYIKSFGDRGQGPGEFAYISALKIVDDTLFVPQLGKKLFVKYSTEGNFLGTKCFNDNSTPLNFIKCGDRYLGRSVSTSYDQETQISTETPEISLYDLKLNKLKTLYAKQIKTSRNEMFDPAMKDFRYTFHGNRFYIVENSYDEYKINEYDTQGNLLRVIRKNYSRMKHSDETIKKYKEINEKHGTKFDVKYHKAIYDVFADKCGRLWVQSPVNVTDGNWQIYDIFQDGIFLQTVTIEIPKQVKIFTSKGKLIGIEGRDPVTNNGAEKVTLYDY